MVFADSYHTFQEIIMLSRECKHPGKPDHSFLEISRHTDYVPGGDRHAQIGCSERTVRRCLQYPEPPARQTRLTAVAPESTVEN
jgi:hypothetical protein